MAQKRTFLTSRNGDVATPNCSIDGMAGFTVAKDEDLSREIADLAYSFWLARCFQNGSPERDFLRAVIEITFRPTSESKAPHLFLVHHPKPDSRRNRIRPAGA
jgi:Protein of unknown function (DUF2934)